MQLQHHSTVELINRLAERGAVVRQASEEDKREVFINLTKSGDALLRKLSLVHHAELETTAPALAKTFTTLMRANRKSRSAA
jgi:DNA-binding MarR family transcriptional regulator